jgi:tetratricopeptide (TPR) repeat protein
MLADLAHNKAYLAELLLKTDRAAEAETLLCQCIASRERMIEDHPDHFDNWRRLDLERGLLCDCLLALARLQEAELSIRQRLTTRQKLLARFPQANSHPYDLGWTHYDLGLALQNTGRPQEAAEAFRESRKQFELALANDPDARRGVGDHALAWFLIDCPAIQFRDPARAVELARRALQSAPQSGRYWFTLGLAQYRAGQPRDAIASLHKSMDLMSGGNSRQWFFLGMAHWQIGEKDEARKWYDRAAQWMEKNRRRDDELRRFRAEAEVLMGKPVGKT